MIDVACEGSERRRWIVVKRMMRMSQISFASPNEKGSDKQEAEVGFKYNQECARLESKVPELEELLEMGDCLAHQPVDFSFTNALWRLNLAKTMAFEVYGILAGSVSPLTGEYIKPAHGGEKEAFLKKGFAAVLAILITGTSQSRQHVVTSLIRRESHKSPTMSLFDVGSSRISIFIVNDITQMFWQNHKDNAKES
ncbi:reverse transcriptase domain-containing protein [Tanacetum coccineum]